MKKNIILLGMLLLFVTGSVSAQICPPTNNSRSAYNVGNYNSSFNNFSRANYSLDRLAFSFSSIISDGYRKGNLTHKEIRNLERDFRNVEREMRWAYADRRVSLHERSLIDMYIRRLERNISREWNDNEVRVG